MTPQLFSGQLAGQPHCPACQHLLDGFSTMREDARPRTGSITICCYCAELLELTAQMTHILITKERLAALRPAELEAVQRGRRAIVALIQSRCRGTA